MRKRLRFTIVICLTLICTLYLYKFYTLPIRPSTVPNIFHYVIFGRKALDFITFLSMTSVVKVHKPQIIYIHTDSGSDVCNGKYWELLLKLSALSGVVLSVKHLDKPSHVYGQRLSSVYHSSDIARLMVLKEFGGVYLDTDVLVLKSLIDFMKSDVTIAKPKNDYIGNQVIISIPNGKFLNEWLQGYKTYKPRSWYYNAGHYPTELLEKKPHLAHVVNKEFGVQNLLKELFEITDWNGWKSLYTIHLLSRHPPFPISVNEYVVQSFHNAFGDIAKWLLFISPPQLNVKTLSWEGAL